MPTTTTKGKPAPMPVAERARMLVEGWQAASEAEAREYERMSRATALFGLTHKDKGDRYAYASRWERHCDRFGEKASRYWWALIHFILRVSGWEPSKYRRISDEARPAPAIRIGETVWAVVVDEEHDDTPEHRIVRIDLANVPNL